VVVIPQYIVNIPRFWFRCPLVMVHVNAFSGEPALVEDRAFRESYARIRGICQELAPGN
jgi:hypothetical protein